MKSLFNDFKFKVEDFDDILWANYSESNITKLWKASDTKDMFERRLSEGNKEYWKDKVIEYRYNNYGFRTDDDFNGYDEGVITLGCSFTEGIGLPIEYTWGYKIAKYLNTKHWNFGVGAMGLDTAFRYLVGASEKLKFNKVFLFVPPFYRNEFIIRDNELIKPYLTEGEKRDIVHTLGNRIDHNIFINMIPEHEAFFKAMLFGSEKNEVLRMVRGLSAIKGLCEFLGIEFYYQTFSEYFNKETNEKASLISDDICPDIPARDQHWNAKKQHLIYQRFIENYENNNR
jgi:hypothetical protein|tara:strand:+ start:36 stop:893 length:858 start_codon:yes stop_codon:yes gene_type:complete